MPVELDFFSSEKNVSMRTLSSAAMNPLTTTTTSVISTPLPATTSSELHHHLAKTADVKPNINSIKNIRYVLTLISVVFFYKQSKIKPLCECYFLFIFLSCMCYYYISTVKVEALRAINQIPHQAEQDNSPFPLCMRMLLEVLKMSL